MLIQDLYNNNSIIHNFRPSKSAPCSPVKPIGNKGIRSEPFHIIHKVPLGDTPYVIAKNLVDKDPERAIPLFWAAINAGDRQNRAEEAIEAIKSLRSQCSDQAQESLDNILLDLYKFSAIWVKLCNFCCCRDVELDDQIGVLKHKLLLIQQGMAFNGRRTKTAPSQGRNSSYPLYKKQLVYWEFRMGIYATEQLHQAEDAYRRALLIASDNNKMCNLGICLMKQGRISEAKETLRQSNTCDFGRAQQMLKDIESEIMNKDCGEDRVQQSRLFDAFLGFFNEQSSSGSIQSKTEQAIAGTNSLNIDAPPFYSSKLVKNAVATQAQDNSGLGLKRIRSGNAECAPAREVWDYKTRKRSPVKEDSEWAVLPDSNAFEEALMAAVIGTTKTAADNCSNPACQRKVDQRLRVFRRYYSLL
ncbi:hypothetical protein MKW92_050825 [Papaver armeniacum]|nr:hypothetical protein MKW92_050825 [Papaver armeniacum]